MVFNPGSGWNCGAGRWWMGRCGVVPGRWSSGWIHGCGGYRYRRGCLGGHPAGRDRAHRPVRIPCDLPGNRWLFRWFSSRAREGVYRTIQHMCYIMLQTIQGVKGIMVLLDAKGTFWCISCLPIGMRMLRISACATVRSFRRGCSSMVSARPCSRSVCNAPGAPSTAF